MGKERETPAQVMILKGTPTSTRDGFYVQAGDNPSPPPPPAFTATTALTTPKIL